MYTLYGRLDSQLNLHVARLSLMYVTQKGHRRIRKIHSALTSLGSTPCTNHHQLSLKYSYVWQHGTHFQWGLTWFCKLWPCPQLIKHPRWPCLCFAHQHVQPHINFITWHPRDRLINYLLSSCTPIRNLILDHSLSWLFVCTPRCH